MAIFEPLAFLAALFAACTALSWWEVAKVTQESGGNAAKVSRKLYIAAVGTMLTLALACASIVAPSLASLII